MLVISVTKSNIYLCAYVAKLGKSICNKIAVDISKIKENNLNTENFVGFGWKTKNELPLKNIPGLSKWSKW